MSELGYPSRRTAWLAQLLWVVPLLFFVGMTVWVNVTRPAGADWQVTEGQCYRVGTQRIAGMVFGYYYQQVVCGPELP